MNCQGMGEMWITMISPRIERLSFCLIHILAAFGILQFDTAVAQNRVDVEVHMDKVMPTWRSIMNSPEFADWTREIQALLKIESLPTDNLSHDTVSLGDYLNHSFNHGNRVYVEAIFRLFSALHADENEPVTRLVCQIESSCRTITRTRFRDSQPGNTRECSEQGFEVRNFYMDLAHGGGIEQAVTWDLILKLDFFMTPIVYDNEILIFEPLTNRRNGVGTTRISRLDGRLESEEIWHDEAAEVYYSVKSKGRCRQSEDLKRVF